MVIDNTVLYSPVQLEGQGAIERRLNAFVSFAWREEEIGFEAVLTGVKIVVTAVEVVESLVGATFHDSSLLYD